MTDARPEPDKIEAEEPEARPEPVWARPTSPDPWGKPADEPAQTPEPVAERSSVASSSSHEQASDQPRSDQPRSDESAPVEQASSEPVVPSEPGAPWEPAASAEQDAPTQAVPDRTTQTQPAETVPLPDYSPPQYQPPAYPPQYPQYTAPQGFGSPHGPDPLATTQSTAPEVLEGQPGQPGQPAETGQVSQVGQDFPWYADPNAQAGTAQPGQFNQPAQFNQPGQFGQPAQPGQPGQPGLFGPPTQQWGGSSWPPQPYPAGNPNGRKKGRVALIALLVGACLLVGVLGGVAGSALRDDVTDSSGRNPTINLPDPAPVDANRATSQVTKVAAAVLPSVVSLNVQAGQEAGTGSGFVIDAARGYILTNNHVVTAGGSTAATSIKVIFQDGTEVPGKVVGLDASYDLAVVKVTAKGLKQLTLGDSDAVRVGDPVVAIGAPLGLQGTVTTGIVSALNRPVAAGEGNKPAFINAIQTDAAINPGNSGGPLVDASGNVIAVNSAIARSPGSTGTTAGNIGLGFAIPSNQARRTAEQLIRTGKASHPIIGVSLDSTYTGRGVKVSEQASPTGVKPVTENGPADQAGIKAGDVILKIDGRPVTEPDELIVAIRAQTPGETITLTVQRGTSESEVRVKLSEATD